MLAFLWNLLHAAEKVGRQSSSAGGTLFSSIQVISESMCLYMNLAHHESVSQVTLLSENFCSKNFTMPSNYARLIASSSRTTNSPGYLLSNTFALAKNPAQTR